MKELTRNGTNDRVYGGDCELIHVRDGNRGEIGKQVAIATSLLMRNEAKLSGKCTDKEVQENLLCPGCYMIVGFNSMIYLAIENKQPLLELASTMTQAWGKFAQMLHFAKRVGAPEQFVIEEIQVMLAKEARDD